MALTYTITDLPPVWPGKRTAHPKTAPFKSQWSRTEKALERELGYRHLGARKIELAIDLPRGAMDLRRDGMLKADARPKPPVILSFLDRDGVRQAYPCDTYGWWEDNLHAIAVVLEDLRRAERYGVQSALLRAGFKQLPATTAPTMSAQQAAEYLAEQGGDGPGAVHILGNADSARLAYRHARMDAHPDRGGSAERFNRVQEAAKIIGAHHGVTL